jgi:hypothetical protein
MKDASKDTGVIIALLKRFNEQRLPEMLALKKSVEQGKCLSKHDITFLEKVYNDASQAMPLVDKHPDLEPIASRAISLFKEITEKALENEKQS